MQVKKASIQKLKNERLILHLSLDGFEMEELLLEKGVQPEGLFKIMISRRGGDKA